MQAGICKKLLNIVQVIAYSLSLMKSVTRFGCSLGFVKVAEYCPRNCVFSITYELSDEIWVQSVICKKLLNIVQESAYSLSLMNSVTRFGCSLGFVRSC